MYPGVFAFSPHVESTVFWWYTDTLRQATDLIPIVKQMYPTCEIWAGYSGDGPSIDSALGY